MSTSRQARLPQVAAAAFAGAAMAMLAFSSSPFATTDPVTTPLDAVLAAQQARAALIQQSDAIADLVEQVSPSVVGIRVAREGDHGMGGLFGRQPHTQRGAGSGVIVHADGTIVTNHHVVEGASSLRVSMTDGREFDAEVIGSDPGTDVAVLRVISDEPLSLIPLVFSDASARPGETVVAIGSPFGLSNSVSRGIVSAVGRGRMGIVEFEDFIQTDAAINPGNSGGALVNARGQLIGINTAIFSRSGGSQGIGFAVPASQVSTVTQALLEDGRVSRGWLGVGIAEASDGVRITLVEDAGPAASAGLTRGDIVVSINDEAVATPDELRDRIVSFPAGSTIELEVQRKDEVRELSVQLDERPSQEQQMRLVR